MQSSDEAAVKQDAAKNGRVKHQRHRKKVESKDHKLKAFMFKMILKP